MGATYDEVVADYMTTYVNYYHLEEGGEQYEAVKNSNIVSILTNITGAAEGTDLTTVDLAAAAEDYMLDAGLTADEVTALKANLAKDYGRDRGSRGGDAGGACSPGPDLHRGGGRLPVEHRL